VLFTVSDLIFLSESAGKLAVVGIQPIRHSDPESNPFDSCSLVICSRNHVPGVRTQFQNSLPSSKSG